MKKTYIVFGVVFTVFLMVSVATALPYTNSKVAIEKNISLTEIEKEVEEVKEKRILLKNFRKKVVNIKNNGISKEKNSFVNNKINDCNTSTGRHDLIFLAGTIRGEADFYYNIIPPCLWGYATNLWFTGLFILPWVDPWDGTIYPRYGFHRHNMKEKDNCYFNTYIFYGIASNDDLFGIGVFGSIIWYE
jgi:hypothetical protein